MAQIKTNLQYGVTGTVQSANVADDAVTLAKMASGTDGNVITYDASGNPAVVATGTSGHFLKSQGSGSVPVFAAAGGGKVLQVVSTNKTNTFTSTSTSFVDVTGLTLNITPAATSSKILVIVNVAHSDGADRSYVRLMRDSTAIAIGDAASNRPRVSGGATHAMTTYSIYNTAFNYLDSPSSTSAIAYHIETRSLGDTLYINRSEADRDVADYEPRAASTITAIEIGA